jgi:large subunit ribosomal protein L10
MPNKKNLEEVQLLTTKIKEAKSVVVVNYQGLEVNEVNDLRAQLRKKSCDLRVSKNTLIKIALKEAELYSEENESFFEGPNALLFSNDDPVAGIKTAVDYAKEHSKDLPILKLGFIEGLVAKEENLKVLSELPSKEQLIGKFVNVINSPIAGFVKAINNPTTSFVGVLSQITKKKEEV